MQLHPWELVHPTHLTLVNHHAESNDSVDEPRGRRDRSSTFSSSLPEVAVAGTREILRCLLGPANIFEYKEEICSEVMVADKHTTTTRTSA